MKYVLRRIFYTEQFAKGRMLASAPTDLLFINGLMYTQSRALSFRSESEESHIDSDCVVMRFFANQRFALNDRIIVCVYRHTHNVDISSAVMVAVLKQKAGIPRLLYII